MSESVVDLGCGNNKHPGAFGVDGFSGAGVDLVADLDQVPWPIEDRRFDKIICRHIFEHVADPVAFMAEVHRIGKPKALVHVFTPHFSSVCSWADPTHRRHLSTDWYKLFVSGGYLVKRTGLFEPVSSGVTFGHSARCIVSSCIAKAVGLRRWEKYFAFGWQARDVESVLRVVK